MDKNNFKFNDKTLEYEKVEISFVKRLQKAGLHLGVSLVLAIVIIVLSYPIVARYSEKEKNQEIEKLHNTYSNLNKQIQEISLELEVE